MQQTEFARHLSNEEKKSENTSDKSKSDEVPEQSKSENILEQLKSANLTDQSKLENISDKLKVEEISSKSKSEPLKPKPIEDPSKNEMEKEDNLASDKACQTSEAFDILSIAEVIDHKDNLISYLQSKSRKNLDNEYDEDNKDILDEYVKIDNVIIKKQDISSFQVKNSNDDESKKDS